MIRLVEEKDLFQIHAMLRKYMEESKFYNNMDFDSDAALDFVWFKFLQENPFTAVAVDGDTVKGFVTASIAKPFHKQPVAFEEMFYILPQYRRSKDVIKLCTFFIEQCRIRGAVKLFSTSTAGFDNDGHHASVFTRLLKRLGFVEIKGGSVLIKDFSDE